MIDLSHLTEEEQGMILTVLQRDAELKKAEEERIGKLSVGSRSETKLKYLTGEWFYEAKSRRHSDKIHGSEIILASMNPRRASNSDGSIRLERPRATSGRGSDIVAPPKPARCMEATQPQDKSDSDAEMEKLNVAMRSPARPRHNPFNRASLILVEAPETAEKLLTNGNQARLTPSETEPIYPPKNHTDGHASQTLVRGAITSEGSSCVGFRPVPKKRTFLSRRPAAPSGSDSSGLGPQSGSKVVVAAPRGSPQHGSSEGSNQSSMAGMGEQSQNTTTTMTNQVSPSGQPLNTPNQASPRQLCYATQVTLNNKQERDGKPSSIVADNSSDNSYHTPSFKASCSPDGSDTQRNSRTTTYTKNERPADSGIPGSKRSEDDLDQREYAGMHTTSLTITGIQDPEKPKTRNLGAEIRQEDLSLTEYIVDLPPRYDLNFIDKPEQHTPQRSRQKLASKSSPKTPSPSGEEDESIAKVLEWFSRSTDSNEWLDTEDDQQDTINIDGQGGEDTARNDTGDNCEIGTRDGEREAPETKREDKEAKKDVEKMKSRATDSKEKKEGTEMREEVRKCQRAQATSREVDANEKESQLTKISRLKSFWEEGNTGPKILISRSNSSADKGQKLVPLATEKESEKEVKENKPRISEVHSGPGPHGAKGTYEKRASNLKEGREKDRRDRDCGEKVQSDVSPNPPVEYIAKRDDHISAPETPTSPTSWPKQQSPRTQRKEDTTDDRTLPAHPQVEDQRGSDAEILSLTRLSCQPDSHFQSRFTSDSERLSSLKMSPQPDTLFQYKGNSPLPVKTSSRVTTPLLEDSSRASPSSQLDTSLHCRASPDSEKLYQSRYGLYSDYQRGGNDLQVSPKTQRGSSEEGKRRDMEERSAQSTMSAKKQDNPTNKDRVNNPHAQRQASQCQESMAERIKQLKSFWEQERNKPVFYTGKSKGSGDGKDTHGQNLGRLNKRFTKSEYDLRTLCNDSGSDMEDSDKDRQNSTIPAPNQRLDKSSPPLAVNRAQFRNLREFWGEATSNCRPKSPKKKEQIDAQSPALEFKHGVDTDFYRKSTPVHGEKKSARTPAMRSSLPSQNHSKSPSERQIGSAPGVGNGNEMNQSHCIAVESGKQRDSRRSLKDSARDEKSTKLQSNQSKETRPPKTRKDSSGNSGGHGSSLRRATSMHVLNVNEEEESPSLGQLKKTQESSPVQPQGKRQGADRMPNRRQSSDRVAVSRKSSADSESLTPRARSFVPRDYRYYLGMTEETSVHTSLAPAVKEQELDSKAACELDLSGPVRASTPVGSEEHHGRRAGKATQRPLWVNHSSSDMGRESSVSSTSDTWPNSENSSNRENHNEDSSPVRRALRRAEARPKNLAKSLEDVTASSPPLSSVPSPSSSSSFSDPERVRKMSKSVPSFLQKELSGSVTTMYSGDLRNVEVQGNIQFSINYVQKLREFHIFVAQCRDLAAVEPRRGRSDPYVKSYLVPDKANLGKRKTSVKKKTLNPTFNEILRYRVRMEYVRTQTLVLSVWHHDTFGKNSFLGEVDVDLSTWDFDHTQMNYLALKARSPSNIVPSGDRGEMRLAIRFLPQISHSEGVGKEGPNTGEVHIWVKECKNLPLIRTTIDPYVKCFVLPDTSKKSRQKTRVLRRTVEPIFNHTMVYDGIRQGDLMEACVELTVWDRDRLASNLLGGLRLGLGTGKSYGAVVHWMDSTRYEVTLWERMMASPNEWVEGVLPLRVLTSAKTALK